MVQQLAEVVDGWHDALAVGVARVRRRRRGEHGRCGGARAAAEEREGGQRGGRVHGGKGVFRERRQKSTNSGDQKIYPGRKTARRGQQNKMLKGFLPNCGDDV